MALPKIIRVRETMEDLPNKKGVISSFFTIDRITNEVLNTSYHYSPKLFSSSKDVKVFNTYTELITFLNSLDSILELVDDDNDSYTTK